VFRTVLSCVHFAIRGLDEAEFKFAMGSPHFTGGPGKSKRLLLLGIPVAILLTAALAVVFNARRALNHATQAAAGEGQLAFTLRTLDISSKLAQSLGAETIGSTPRYATGAFFAGNLYLGGPSGLVVLRADGTSRLNLRSGFELPIAPINSIATGRLRGSGGQQLLLATGGAGLLLLEPGSGANPTIRQLLPADAEARDLTAILPLTTGDVLIGTRHRGVFIYNGATLVPVRFTLPGVNPASLQITALAAVDSASFLIGTRNSGVFYVHAGTVDHASSGSGMPDDQVESIAVSSSRAFVGTPVGTAEFDLAAPSFRPMRILAQGIFSHALALDEHQLTIGTVDQGIQQVALEGGPSLRRVSISAGPTTASLQRVDAFLPAPDALYALADGTLLQRTGALWAHALPPAPAGLADANISALAFAPDGTLYIGFFDHGIDLLSPEGAIRHLEDDHLYCINRLVLDPQRHTIDAATADGLVLFDAQGKPRQTLTHRDGLISDHVTDVAFTRGGTALATPAGITFLGPAGAESLYAFQGLVNNHVYALTASNGSDELIAGTLGGVSILRAHAVERNLTVANSDLKHNWITALLSMPDKTVLVGTYGAGVETLSSQGRFTPIELPAGMPRDLVVNPNAIYATSLHIYAGTLANGMLVYSISSGRWSAVTTGLPSLNVTAFAARAGEIYVGTENGLVRMPEANLP
jgi:outer membrane protein assembly factor BamB